jgi:serine/threonine protein kinase
MVVNTLEPFKKSPEFEEWKKTHENSNLAVLINDFDYMAILGQGGFGRVVHVRKKTTGRHFAMKIQPKTALYDEHGGNLGDLHTEKTVFANCQHPFIVDMCYALQTKNHAILVLGLVDGGDLNDLLWRAEGGRVRLDEERSDEL